MVKKANAREYLGYLLDDAKIYRSLYEASYGWNKNESAVARSLMSMKMFKLSQPIPATLALVRAYRLNIIKYAKLRDALAAVENFHFQFTAITSSRSSGGISAMYSSFAQRLFECSDSQAASSEIEGLKKKLRDRTPSLEEFIVAFREVSFTNSNSKQKNLVRYILRKFAQHYGYKFSYDYDDLTIEHIHPQSKLEGLWSDANVGQLGNLILLDQEMNEKIDRKDFPDKKAILLENNYQIPEFVLGSTKWNVEDVRKHTDEMATIAHSSIWKI